LLAKDLEFKLQSGQIEFSVATAAFHYFSMYQGAVLLDWWRLDNLLLCIIQQI